MVARFARRQALPAIALVWVLVCGGLTWATFSAVQLEEVGARAKAQQNLEANIVLAIARLDNRVASILERERAWPYFYFRPYYVVANPLDTDLSRHTKPIREESPLRKLPDHTGWLLLHFQASEVKGWSSPQLEKGSDQAIPASFFRANDRERPSPDNWLAAMRERYTPFKLQQVLEQYLDFYRSIYGFSESKSTSRPATDDSMLASAGEFARRGARMLQAEREQGEICEPETVALENLEAGEIKDDSGVDRNGCAPIVKTRMVPVWLELTMDERLQLAMVRSVTVENSQFCTLQGVLLDWDKIRAILEEQVAEQLPGAKLVPVKADSHVPLNLLGSMMQNLPLRLEIPQAVIPETSISTGLRIGLSLAWLTALLGLGAITYGTLKFVTLAERQMQFVAAVSHELRTPLTSFQLYSDLLLDMDDTDNARRRQYAETLRMESKRLTRLVENVLAYARISGNGPRVQLSDLTPAEILEKAKIACASSCSMAGKEIVIENRCSPKDQVRTDVQFVEQILVNLIENACKYSSGAPDNRIWVSALHNSDGTFNFEVDDAGPGVPHSERQTVFRPFQRGESPQSQKAGGIGLGLTMSRYWAHCLGGKLMLRRSSRNGSHYSCFSLQLPAFGGEAINHG